jgi:hypothetical protein
MIWLSSPALATARWASRKQSCGVSVSAARHDRPKARWPDTQQLGSLVVQPDLLYGRHGKQQDYPVVLIVHRFKRRFCEVYADRHVSPDQDDGLNLPGVPAQLRFHSVSHIHAKGCQIGQGLNLVQCWACYQACLARRSRHFGELQPGQDQA